MSSTLKIAGIFTAAAITLTAAAQTNLPPTASTTSAPPAGSRAEKISKGIKNPAPWFNWGADLRIRNEYFNNVLTLNPNNSLHEQDYFRFRARVWSSIKPVDDVSLNIRLATEPREWMRPAGFTPYKGRTGLDWTEGVFDGINVQWRNVLQQPATLTVGRQDIMLGDGWLVAEGTPYDGSWTIYLDSARFSYELKEQHTVFEAIGIIQDAYDDGWLPTINDSDRIETEQNEKGAVFSVANSSLRAANLTGYFIYKHDDRVTAMGDNANICTIDGRLSGLLGDHWKYSVEGAYQFGNKQDLNIKFPAVSTAYRTLDAYGVNSKLTYSFKDRLNNQLNFSFECLSGDNPNSKNDEMFDVLWGRWPRWSEIGLYSYAAETRIGQEANLCRFGPGWSCSPVKDMDFSANYCALFAPEPVPTREASPTLFSNTGNFRGHFAEAVLKYKFGPHVSAHLWSEFLWMGDYYQHRDLMTFLRGEVMFTF